jgi:putative sterol carrier protein
MAVDVKKLFNEDLKGAVERNPADAKKIGGLYELNITGAGTWTVDLKADVPRVHEGPATNPDATIEVAENDFQTLYTNPKSEAMKLFFEGKLKVKGNQMLAMNLPNLFALK